MSAEFGSEFGYSVKTSQQAFRSAMDDHLASFGLSTPQYTVLEALDKLSEASNAELARACFVTPQTMHGIIVNLERRGLIARPTTASEGRALKATLTATGTDTLRAAAGGVADIDSTATAGIPATELAVARSVLDTTAANLRESLRETSR